MVSVSKNKAVSFMYSDPRLYKLIMKILYGKYYLDRYKVVNELVPDGSGVLDMCCGDCELYKSFFAHRNIFYTGIDYNAKFVSYAKKNSINVILSDIRKDIVPRTDYIIMQGSLYQFIPDHKDLIDRLLNSTRKQLIITEPIINLSSSNNPIIRFVAQRSGNPGTGHAFHRFTEKSFHSFFLDNYKKLVVKFDFIPGGREMMVILNSRS